MGEDALCCALGERLVSAALPNWDLAGPSINTRGVTKLVPALHRYAEQAKYVQPVLCIADTDGRCAVDLIKKWRPEHSPESLVLRLAVTEAESWLLADRKGFAAALKVPVNKVPSDADGIDDPKRLVLKLVAKSKTRLFRDEVVSRSDPAKPGTGYNLHLCAFARAGWDAQRARPASVSLDRALLRLETLGIPKN